MSKRSAARTQPESEASVPSDLPLDADSATPEDPRGTSGEPAADRTPATLDDENEPVGLVSDVAVKDPGAEPEPLVGDEALGQEAESDVQDPIGATQDRARRLEDLGPHGFVADVRNSEAQAVSTRRANPADADASAEAIDALADSPSKGITPDDVARAAHKASEVAVVYQELLEEYGSEIAAIAIRLAADKVNPVEAARVAARAAKESDDAGKVNTRLASAVEAVEGLESVASPHGRQAELADPYAANQWSVHGDMTQVADSPNDTWDRIQRAMNPPEATTAAAVEAISLQENADRPVTEQ